MPRMPETPSPSRVVKIPEFKGSLPTRPLYIYLPPGYDDETETAYPVLYMHDGQNVFEAYVKDSFAGFSWRADEAADSLIASGDIRPLIIVGVSNGDSQRTAEYLPPYMTIFSKRKAHFRRPITGKADKVLEYYRFEVDPYVRTNYRLLPGRDNVGTCGSSMGGLLSNYFAWEAPDFARHHAIVSPAYWLTRNQEGGLEMLEQMYFSNPPDVRIWLDSGSEDIPGKGDDGMRETIMARDLLIKLGFRPGKDFCYYLDKGAIHTEASWAERFPKILKFLFPQKVYAVR